MPLAAAALRLFREVTVEPVYILVSACLGLFGVASQSMVIQKVWYLRILAASRV